MNASHSTIFLVDDDVAVLTALSRLLSANGYKVLAFHSPQTFLDQHDASVVGCAVLDLAMPGLDGLELQSALSRCTVPRPVVFLTGRADIPSTIKAMKRGAVDFLRKPLDSADLLRAVARAVQQDFDARRLHDERAELAGRFARLTPRQREVLVRVIAGKLNKQIAAELGTTEKTIKVHRGRVMQKLGVRTMVDLLRLADRAGVTPVGNCVSPRSPLGREDKALE